MNNEITITADELFCIGKLMNAEYIDYAYIVCMNDSADDFNIREKAVKQGLIKKELVFESFSGKTDVDESLTELLLPVFYGKKETSINICTIKEQAEPDILKFHFHDGRITLIKAENGLLTLKGIRPDDIEKIVSGIFSDESEFSDGPVSETDGIRNVSAIMSVKSLVLEERSVVHVFMKSGGIWYMDKGHNTFENVSRTDFIDLVTKLFKG